MGKDWVLSSHIQWQDSHVCSSCCCFFSFLFFKYLFVWLHLVLGHSGLQSSLQCVGSPSCSMRYLVPWPGMEPRPLHWEWGVLATGPPGKPHCPCFCSPLSLRCYWYNKASKRNKRQLDCRGRSKLSLFTDNMIDIKIRWKLINEFGEVAGYNFSI